ncbi:hypothetical protein [Nostoc commune]|uniref:hypothetical protein n=1 Tax=Nostoc commune TaxID=1178 RepID=UPI0018C773B1|nr:hypothetical protein [Nostoc commune]
MKIKLNEVFNLPYIPDLIAQKLASTEKSILSDVNVAFHQIEYERLRNKLQEVYEYSPLSEVPSGNVDLHNLLVRLRTRSYEL